jgi:gluconolactonase
VREVEKTNVGRRSVRERDGGSALGPRSRRWCRPFGVPRPTSSSQGRARLSVWLLLLAGALWTPACQRLPSPSPSHSAHPDSLPPNSAPVATFLRLDPRFDRIVPPGTIVERLGDGYQWTEGPVWDHREESLLFTNIPANEILQWKEGKGITQFLFPSGYSGREPFPGREPGANGLTWDAEGRLVLCQHGDRRIARLEKDGKTLTSLAERYQGRRFNSPNDLVFHANGDLYFTDPPYGLPQGMDDPGRELPSCGVYRLTPQGEVQLLTDEISRPNGIAFSPDQRQLYVASSDPERAIWMVYDVTADGRIGHGKVFFDATAWVKEGRKGLPDGLKVDLSGNLFATGPGGVLVFAPDGTHLGSIETGVPTANCAWGGDGATLYITANTSLLRVALSTRGF